MIIQPIVEGHGEITAVPELLRRLIAEAGYPSLQVGKPIRAHRPNLADKNSVEKYIALARLRPSDAILILLDADKDCPLELAPTIQEWARVAANPLPCEVVFAAREYEAWFLAAMESLRGHRGITADSNSEADPEGHRNAKAMLQKKMRVGHFYVETSDQVALTAAFDMRVAHQRCRSFRKMVKAFGNLAAGCNTPISKWPPAGW
jgi:hypothetical protein